MTKMILRVARGSVSPLLHLIPWVLTAICPPSPMTNLIYCRQIWGILSFVDCTLSYGFSISPLWPLWAARRGVGGYDNMTYYHYPLLLTPSLCAPDTMPDTLTAWHYSSFAVDSGYMISTHSNYIHHVSIVQCHSYVSLVWHTFPSHFRDSLKNYLKII